MIDQKGFGGNVGIVGSGRSMYVASLLVLHIGLARSFSVDGYGAFQQVYLLNVVFMILSLGIPETIYYFLPRLDAERRSAFLGQTMLLLGTAAALVVIALGFGAPFLARLQNNPVITESIRLFGIYGAFTVLASFADPIFIYFRHVRYLFVLSAAHGLFLIALTIWRTAADIPIETIFGAMMVFGSFKCLAAFAFLYHIREETGPIRFFGPERMVGLQLSFALPIALTTTIDSLSRWLDKIVVSFVLGTEPLGLFSVGAIEIPFVTVFVTTVYGLVSPRLNELEHAGEHMAFAELAGKLLSFTAKLVWPVAVYLFAFADHIVPLVFTGAYTESVLPFRIYLAMMPLRIFMFGVLIIALGKPRIILYGSAGALAVNLVLNVVLVKWIGFAGPAIATVASTYLQVLFLFLYIVRRLGAGARAYVPAARLFRVAAASLLAAAAAYLFTSAYQRDLTVVFLSLTIMTAAYIFLGSWLGLFHIAGAGDLLRGRISEKR